MPDHRRSLITVAVRTVVEFVHGGGDLVAAVMGARRAQAGTRGHRIVRELRPAGYEAEVPLRLTVPAEGVDVEVQGRADGIFRDEAGAVVIDEIKTTNRALADISPDDRPLHWYQAMLYGHIYALREELPTIDVQLTYYQLRSGELREFRRSFSAAELTRFFNDTVAPYVSWIVRVNEWERLRDQSTVDLPFPYPSLRAGQAELCETVATTLASGSRLFARAPTGIGKTIAVLYPAVQALGAGRTDRIFYLTARTTGRSVAEKTLADLRSAGLHLRAVTLTAKDKICFYGEARCHPASCPCAAGHFDRVNGALAEAFDHEALTRPVIEAIARQHNVCPFEFSLDVASWSDAVICDYNYVFDPQVHLRRFFSGANGRYTLLIDEAHNLVDRGRDMFSTELSKRLVLDAKKAATTLFGRAKRPALTTTTSPAPTGPAPTAQVHDLIKRLNRWFIDQRKSLKAEGARNAMWEAIPLGVPELASELGAVLEELIISDQARRQETSLSGAMTAAREVLLELYFACLTFERTVQRYGSHYVTLFEGSSSRARLRLFCIDPGPPLQSVLKSARAACFFSATLTPLEYYRTLLGGSEEDGEISLPSPFPAHNLGVFLADRIATTYRKRHLFYGHVARALHAFVSGRPGNYLCFFPSYAYLNEVYGLFTALDPVGVTLVQRSGMSEDERDEFLASFAAEDDGNETLVAFAVMGGIFGEGIDLVGDRLVGTAIVGVGIPQVCLERDVIRRHFEEERNAGFQYAYQYPGMTRVLQAAGRLIRTETDRGVLLLIDERFAWDTNQQLLPPEWPVLRTVRTPAAVAEAVSDFWGLDEIAAHSTEGVQHNCIPGDEVSGDGVPTKDAT